MTKATGRPRGRPRKVRQEDVNESVISITMREYIERFFKIRTKDGTLSDFHMNWAQEKLYDVFAEAHNRDEPVKIIVLKARQLGISTVTESILAACTMMQKYKNALIMAHDPQSTANIFDMTRRYYDNLPPQLKPMTKYNSLRTLDFQNPTNDPAEKHENPGLQSKITVATAGQYAVGRGSTYQYMHLSEVAFWKEQDGKTVQDQLTGLLQTLPQNGSSLLVIESTANGYNYFKKLWDDAEAGLNGYVPLFFPWWEHPEYRRPYKKEKLTREEQELKSQYGLDNEQLMWRRYAISDLCGNDVMKFRQEYPSSPEEAFILSGTPFFNAEAVMNCMTKCREPMLKGQFTEYGRWYDDVNGVIEIWEEPEAGHVYAIGADTAGDGSDYFVAYVVDKQTRHQVAKYRTLTDEREFVRQIMALAYMYNTAMIGPEINFSTYVVQTLEDQGYPNLYVREIVDTYTHRVLKKFGFRTTSMTRPLILDGLKALVNEEGHLINDPDFFHEALGFAKNERGKPEAPSGEHDDCIMAMAISYYILDQAQRPVEQDDALDDVFEYSDFVNYGG